MTKLVLASLLVVVASAQATFLNPLLNYGSSYSGLGAYNPPSYPSYSSYSSYTPSYRSGNKMSRSYNPSYDNYNYAAPSYDNYGPSYENYYSQSYDNYYTPSYDNYYTPTYEYNTPAIQYAVEYVPNYAYSPIYRNSAKALGAKKARNYSNNYAKYTTEYVPTTYGQYGQYGQYGYDYGKSSSYETPYEPTYNYNSPGYLAGYY